MENQYSGLMNIFPLRLLVFFSFQRLPQLCSSQAMLALLPLEWATMEASPLPLPTFLQVYEPKTYLSQNMIFKCTGCPPGLQYLTMVDQLLIKQKVEILEAVTGFETANKYEVLNSMGQNVSKCPLEP